MLIHGNGQDASAWFSKSDQSEATLAKQFAQDGYDVFIANLRGSRPSRAHYNPEIDPDGSYWEEGDYWNFDYN